MSVTTAIKEDYIEQQILQAAKRLFTVHGLAKVTMDDVAKAIGKGRSSLYYYYKSKDEIFDAVMNIEIQKMLGSMEKAADRAIGVEKKINAFFITKLDHVMQSSLFYNMLDVGMDADAISNFKKTKVAHHDLIMKQEGALLSEILNEGINTGELKPIDKNDMDTLVFVLLSSLHGLKREVHLELNQREIEPAVNQLTQIIMHGLKK